MDGPGGPGRPLSVALIHYAAPPVIGGVEHVLGRQAVLMADAGHAVRLVAGRGARPDRRVRFTAIRLLDPRHPTIVRLQGALDAGHVPEEFAAVTARIAGQLGAALAGVDVVVAHNVCSLNLNLALTAALRRLADRPGGPRLILWHHDLAWASPAYLPRLHPGPPWDLLRTAWPGVAQVVVSEARRTQLAALGAVAADDISVVPNGVDPSAVLKLGPDAIALLGTTDIAGADPLLLTPTRILPRKNIELGLRVVAAMRDMGRPAGLIVTGPVDPHQSDERAYLEGLRALRGALGLEGHVWLLSEEVASPPTAALMSDLFRVADLLFLPSRDEGFGLPILEAALARLPIVCTDLPSLRELAGDAAFYVQPDADPAAIARSILARLDADPVGRLARAVRSGYAWPVVYRDKIAPLLEPR